MESSAEIMEIFSSIQGEGPLVGERQIFIRFYGCNRSCAYCDTEASRAATGPCYVERTPGQGDFFERSNPVKAGDLPGMLRTFLKEPSLHRTVALTGGEPLLHAGFLAEVLPQVARDIPVLLETNGILHEELGRILAWVSVVSMDLKLASATAEETDWEAHRLFLAAARDKDLYVKTVVTPQVEDREMRRAADLIARIDPSIPLILQPLHGTEGDAVWSRRLFEIQACCSRSLPSVRVIPQMHKLLHMP